jgi:hypothetical protein
VTERGEGDGRHWGRGCGEGDYTPVPPHDHEGRKTSVDQNMLDLRPQSEAHRAKNSTLQGLTGHPYQRPKRPDSQLGLNVCLLGASLPRGNGTLPRVWAIPWSRTPYDYQATSVRCLTACETAKTHDIEAFDQTQSENAPPCRAIRTEQSRALAHCPDVFNFVEDKTFRVHGRRCWSTVLNLHTEPNCPHIVSLDYARQGHNPMAPTTLPLHVTCI